ncbi:MAG: hypothetical protein LQ346_002051 [Caloplaca aetnensis]|nr:MAG: hypothetical protein LQ346_002051 [Caloplaca aetnensis]
MPPYLNGTGIGADLVHDVHAHQTKPMRTVQDFLSNVSNFHIIESTLREGEQFANAFFDTEKKVEIARALDEIGVEYIELTSPASSEQSRRDCEIIANLGLKAKILTHVRCNMEDARLAVSTGVDGVDVVIGTSSYLREHSHGKSIQYIIDTATEVIKYVKSQKKEIRFSSEDSFRSDLVDLLSIYSAVDKIGVTRVGIADTSVLGIGERNGIPSLGGFIARMLVQDREYVKGKYSLTKLKAVEDLVADAVEVHIPFNNPITGFCAFTHKAGIHAKAILANPATYEIINPADFGMQRYVHFASRLTGWNAIKSRCDQLGLTMTDAQIKQCTAKIKAMADVRKLAIEDTDVIINQFYQNLSSETEKPLLDDLTAEEKKAFEEKEMELNGEPEMQKLDTLADAHTNGVVADHL